jgi:glutaredoxin
MNDVICPYCKKDIPINHDDGYGYEENIIHRQECKFCHNTFAYTTEIVFDYEAYTAPCLNGGEHDLVEINSVPKELFAGKKYCKNCGEDFIVDVEANKKGMRDYFYDKG